ncbi:MAG: DNA translocase FtsK, partial [Nitrospirota bacterium]|nr:DNA translocase FtsK [Nitrospirota bacterium]
NKQPFEMTRKVSEGYHPPDPRALLEPPATAKTNQSDQILETQSSVLSSALQSFGISGKVTEVHPGPVITMYEFEPGPGIKVARIVTLAHDLAMALKATSVRIVAPLPGKSTVGIEVPNQVRETVSLREVLTSEHFSRSRSKLALALGKDIFGRPFVVDLRTMPHVLVAGATGAGKSVGLNSMLLSILFSAHPDEVKLLLIDPKVLELQVYDGIPHLLRPVLTNPKAAARGLTWVVQEMERRYRLLAEHGVRHIQSYNLKVAHMQEQAGVPHAKTQTGGGDASSSTEETTSSPEPLPYIVVVIDEFADLMMVAPKEIEEKITRLAQMARASGIHLILATQRPSVDVVTGLIKANFPARIAFQVSSKIDSRTILDANGAEALLGMGDMLYLPPGTGRLTRLHGSFVSDDDVRRVVEYVKAQAGPDYSQDATGNDPIVSDDDDESRDEVFEQAREVVLTSGQASASLIQRRLRVGYPRAARMIEQMEDEGLVSAPGRDGRREVLGPRGTIQEGVR